MAVWITQCLCPERHCITAMAGEAETLRDAETAIASPLRRTLTELLRSGTINPWCGLCGAKSDTWTYETRRTVFATMAEAEPELRRCETEQATSRLVFGDLHRTRPQ